MCVCVYECVFVTAENICHSALVCGVCFCEFVSACVCAGLYVRAHECEYACVCVCVFVCLCVCVFVCLCVLTLLVTYISYSPKPFFFLSNYFFLFCRYVLRTLAPLLSHDEKVYLVLKVLKPFK